MKIIFLDIDGVLNTNKSMNLAYTDRIAPDPNRPWLTMDPNPVTLLEALVNTTGAKIVISSSWRNTSLEASPAIIEALVWAGFQKADAVIDVTPRSRKLTRRGDEIQDWLSRHEVSKFVIIDDDAFDITPVFPKHLVKCDTDVGLTKDKFLQCLKLLKD